VKRRRLLLRILNGSKNISFQDFQSLVAGYGFRLRRIAGSHHIYSHPDIPDGLNLQPARGKAKMYQVRQLLDLVEEYNLHLDDE
jgi:predicted RNA binding protein YcfA (HicA-like mRNA interferase family)